jgi:hypothetical protein
MLSLQWKYYVRDLSRNGCDFIFTASPQNFCWRKAWPGFMTGPLRMQALRTVSARKKILQSLGRINVPVSPSEVDWAALQDLIYLPFIVPDSNV